MEKLIEGYRAFRAARWPAERTNYEQLAKGQKPEQLVIACSDSRADPATIFSARPGEMFVIRNVANIVPPYEEGGGFHGTSAALAFAVIVLQVKNILVMGHAQCGGVAAALDHRTIEHVPFLEPWIDLLGPAIDRCTHDHHQDVTRQEAVERECVKLSLERLMTFPFVAERVQAGSLRLHGARFGIAEGKLDVLDKDRGIFVPVSDR
jgi:carbonic anhydrase